MLPEIGQYALIIALVLSALQSTVPMIGAYRRDPVLMGAGPHLAMGQLFALAFAFALLVQCFVASDFSVMAVAANSHTDKPLMYKIAGVWSNHEGSMLLWVLILAIYGGAVALFGNNLPWTLKARVLSIHGMIGFAFLLFILFTSDPFTRLFPAPANGEGLNPILQDPGLAIHPPMLYMGYVGFSMAFSFSVAALLEGRVDAAWARWVRPWVLMAWICLTSGITLGSFWAYYTLGWGGWWFWDPVENASFMPWLAGTALLHSAIVVERRNALQSWTILLGILAFSLSLIGTFLVRSGVLTSVHSFANDPARGVFILGILVLATGGALVLFAFRAGSLKQGASFAIVSREGGLILNNVFLAVAAGVVFIGTFWPLVVDYLGGDKISVGAPYYNRTFVPVMAPVLFAMVFGPMLRWKRDDLNIAIRRLTWPGIAALVVAIVVLALSFGRSLAPVVGFTAAAWLVLGTLWHLAVRLKVGRVPFDTTLQLATSVPPSTYGLVLAHAGMGVLVAGITGMTAYQTENIRLMSPGETAELSGYSFTLKDVTAGMGPNYRYERAIFAVARNGSQPFVMEPERRFYPVRQQTTTQAAITTNVFRNLYVNMGEQNEGGKYAVRMYYHPLVPWIWGGALLMALGGCLSLADRRLRIGMPQRTPSRPAIVPAE